MSIDIVPVPTDEAVREAENRLLGVETNITVALVGQSGSGKTTLANLLARFWDVSAGAVRRQIGRASCRERV